MKLFLHTSLVALTCLLSGCGQQQTIGPPSVQLGDSVCDQCNMIITDERWATATVVDGPRGSLPLLFDDFNCQVQYEFLNQDLAVLSRWSHSYATNQWLRTEKMSFLVSNDLRTPMGSSMAAFGSEQETESAQSTHPGEVMNFEAAWKHLGFAGFGDRPEFLTTDSDSQEHSDGT